MLENYARVKHGIIKQEHVQKIQYNLEYAKNFTQHVERTIEGMTSLRVGHLVSCLGRLPESVLDYGCGLGHFAQRCASFCKSYGYDINGVPLPRNVRPHNPDNHYDIVTYYDSLEHLDDIWVVGQIKCSHVMISLPWCHYFGDSWFLNWKHRKPNEHLWHFNEKSLEAFFAEFGFKMRRFSSVEDSIRNGGHEYGNILTAFFSK